jgi:hypothetical protein
VAGKKLQEKSKYAVADADGDGVVTDEEMDRHATWIPSLDRKSSIHNRFCSI